MASEYEIKILQGYINRYKKFFSTVSMGYILPASSFILMPLFSAQELPAEGWLPFSIEPLGIYCVVYVNHIYCILQTSFCIFVDFTIVILFSFPAAKLDVLRSKLRHVNNYDMLVSCIKEHQKILGYDIYIFYLIICEISCTFYFIFMQWKRYLYYLYVPVNFKNSWIKNRKDKTYCKIVDYW